MTPHLLVNKAIWVPDRRAASLPSPRRQERLGHPEAERRSRLFEALSLPSVCRLYPFSLHPWVSVSLTLFFRPSFIPLSLLQPPLAYQNSCILPVASGPFMLIGGGAFFELLSAGLFVHLLGACCVHIPPHHFTYRADGHRLWAALAMWLISVSPHEKTDGSAAHVMASRLCATARGNSCLHGTHVHTCYPKVKSWRFYWSRRCSCRREKVKIVWLLWL